MMDEDRAVQPKKRREGYLDATAFLLGGSVLLASCISVARNGVIHRRWHGEPLTREANPTSFWIEFTFVFALAMGTLYLGVIIAVERWRRGRTK